MLRTLRVLNIKLSVATSLLILGIVSTQSAYGQMGGGGMGGSGGMNSGMNTTKVSNGMGAITIVSVGTAYRPDGQHLQMTNAIANR